MNSFQYNQSSDKEYLSEDSADYDVWSQGSQGLSRTFRNSYVLKNRSKIDSKLDSRRSRVDSGRSRVNSQKSRHDSQRSGNHSYRSRNISKNRNTDMNTNRLQYGSMNSSKPKSPINTIKGLMEYLDKDKRLVEVRKEDLNRIENKSCMKEIYQLKQTIYNYQLIFEKMSQQLLASRKTNKKLQMKGQKNDNNVVKQKLKAKDVQIQQLQDQMNRMDGKIKSYKETMMNQNELFKQKEKRYKEKIEKLKNQQLENNKVIQKELVQIDNHKQEIQQSFMNSKQKLADSERYMNQLKKQIKEYQEMNYQQKKVISQQERQINELQREYQVRNKKIVDEEKENMRFYDNSIKTNQYQKGQEVDDLDHLEYHDLLDQIVELKGELSYVRKKKKAL